MYFPNEIICQIFEDDVDSLFMVNKQFMCEYLRLKIGSLRHHTEMPIFKNPIFPYYTFIFKLNIDLREVNYMYREIEYWKMFPLRKLVNCTKIKLVYPNVTYPTHLVNELISALYTALPNLLEFQVTGYPQNAFDLKIFGSSKLRHLKIFSIHDDFLNLSLIENLSSICISNPTGIEVLDENYIFPNVTSFQTHIPFSSIGIAPQIVSSIILVFPNLTRLVISYLFGLDILSNIPRSIQFVEILNTPHINIPDALVPFNTLAITVRSARRHLTDNSILQVLQNHSKTWIMSIGDPSFLIITNHDNFNDIVKWYPDHFKRHFDYSKLFYKFVHFEFNNVHYHYCEARLRKNKFNNTHQLDKYSLFICNSLGNNLLATLLKSKFNAVGNQNFCH